MSPIKVTIFHEVPARFLEKPSMIQQWNFL